MGLSGEKGDATVEFLKGPPSKVNRIFLIIKIILQY